MLHNRDRRHLIILALAVLGLFSCSITKNLSEGEYVITRNTIKLTYPDSLNKSLRLTNDELIPFISMQQIPSGRIFGLSIFQWIYNQSDTSKNNWGNRILRRIGSPSVLYDSTSMAKSRDEMQTYMMARGFYEVEVKDSVTIKRKRAYVNYNITTGNPYIIDSVSYSFTDMAVKPIILSDTASSLIKVGTPLNRIEMDNERSRIAASLENKGYYQFSVSNISYLIDTLKGNHKASVLININKSIRNNAYVDSRIYRIRNIFIDSNYQPYISDSTEFKKQIDTIQYNGINFIYTGGKINVKPEVLARSLSIFPGSIYDREEIEYTSTKLSDLKYFKSINILFNEVKSDSLAEVTYVGAKDSIATTYEGSIDCSILCTPIMNQSYSVDTEISTNSNYTGLSLSLGYANKNIFKGAELFNISTNAAYQFYRNFGNRDSYEFGGAVSMTFVRLLTPFGLTRYSRAFNTSTKVEVSVNTQRRPDYDRTISSLNFGYKWARSKQFSFTLNPIALSLIKVPTIDSTYLSSITNPYLLNSYSDQMILGVSGGVNYSTLNSGRDNAIAVRFNGETSGNTLHMASNLLGSKRESIDNEDYYTIFGIRYAQYVRGEMSLIYYKNMGDKSMIASRIFLGSGCAYGNTKSLPFERMFYSGGSYSMRGWQVRTLGPGATPEIDYDDDDYPNQVGDMRLEANIEGRFPVVGPLHGALFLDVGNIWSNGAGEQNEYARFKFNSFYKQLAINTGLGARFDFDFFVLRVDWGIQLRNPGWETGSQWIDKFSLSNTALHFAIGYPF